MNDYSLLDRLFETCASSQTSRKAVALMVRCSIVEPSCVDDISGGEPVQADLLS